MIQLSSRMNKYSPILVIFFLGFCLAGGIALAATQPAQPASGPGGSDYRHAAVKKNLFGEGVLQYWVFEPESPIPSSAPLIIFNHGWGATNPKAYGSWIEHIVRRGNIVVYPVYQEKEKWGYPTQQITPNAINAAKDAIQRLQQDNYVKPQLDKFAIVGHSAGGQVTANMAALASSSGLPQPRAIMSVQPGRSWAKSRRVAIPLEDMSQVPSGALLLTVAGDRDKIVKDIDAKRIFNEASQVPGGNKNLIILVSDEHGEPALVANHFAPTCFDKDYDSGEKRKSRRGSARGREGRLMSGSRLRERLGERIKENRSTGEDEFPDLGEEMRSADALDYYGLWKLFDGLCDAAFYGKNREYALGNTPQQRFMGNWSDGVAVKELIVITEASN